MELYTTTNIDSLVTQINLERYSSNDNDDAMHWNISYAYGNGGREYYNDKNYSGIDQNGRIMAGGHWIYEKNWTNYIGKNDTCHNIYDDIKHRTPHDNFKMPQTNRNDRLRHDETMDTLIQDTITLTNNLQDRVITYMSNDQLQDADDEWVGLRRVFFENYDPNDTFYVPVRRLISPDWLKWHKNNRQVKIGVNTSTNERIFSVYCLFLPYLEKNFKAHNSPWRNQKYSYDFTVPRTSNIISNNRLWAKIQYNNNKKYSTVPTYDDLLLKYDKYDQPVLHPLFNLQQVYKNELYYSSDDECPPNSLDFEEYNGFLSQKVSKVQTANENSGTQENLATYGPGYECILPTMYCSRHMEDILPD